jgi:hypothetical protein
LSRKFFLFNDSPCFFKVFLHIAPADRGGLLLWSLHTSSVRLPPTVKMAKSDPQIERLGQVLHKSLQRLELSTRLDEYGVWPIWNDVVGSTIARNAQPEKIRNGTLFIKVTSPVWMQQLQYMKEMIAERLNQRLKTNLVKNLFFVVGQVNIEGVEGESKPTPESSTALQDRLNEDFLESVPDPEIRQAFKRLLRSYSRRQRKN